MSLFFFLIKKKKKRKDKKKSLSQIWRETVTLPSDNSPGEYFRTIHDLFPIDQKFLQGFQEEDIHNSSFSWQVQPWLGYLQWGEEELL